ncbi:MAG: hypothetical protein IPJ48_16880 [Propionivibrio sp.]|uniref:Uncharacterized protein n=1 Tax=Candidatus Propionivibrio dominans TaxID=2954373 RepID=A0A9D7FGB1_9RHOO|nr:hypothetical protein [Candidatus Propionivibrio dominans]
MDAGLVLGVCDWGSRLPGRARRLPRQCSRTQPGTQEPSTCARCKNFAVSAQHRPYWDEQVRRHEALLNEPALPIQTLRIVRERLTEARLLIRVIDDDANKEVPHDRKARR